MLDKEYEGDCVGMWNHTWYPFSKTSKKYWIWREDL